MPKLKKEVTSSKGNESEESSTATKGPHEDLPTASYLHGTGPAYNEFILSLRESVRSDLMTSSGIPLLPPKPREGQPIPLINFDIKNAETSHELKVLMETFDIYILAFDINKGEWYEFGKNTKKAGEDIGEKIISDSKYLGFGGGYDSMGKLENVKIGFFALQEAVKDLNVNTKLKKKEHAATIVVMTAEPMRSDVLLQYFTELIEERRPNELLPDWAQEFIVNWKDLCETILEEETEETLIAWEPSAVRRTIVKDDYPTVADIKAAKLDAEKAKNYVNLLLHSALPKKVD